MAIFDTFGRGGLALALTIPVLGGALLYAASRAESAPGSMAADWACPAPQQIPTGYGYPQTRQTLANWVANRNEAATRAHGWGLFAALNSTTGGVPVWQSWCTETQAFADPVVGPVGTHAPTRGERPMRTFKLSNGPTVGTTRISLGATPGSNPSPNPTPTPTPEPINFPTHPVYPIPAAVMNNPAYVKAKCILPPNGSSPIPTLANGPQFQNNGDIMIAGVIYDPKAYDWIRSNQLYTYGKLNALKPKTSTGQTAIPPMPDQSVVLKPMMWPVSAKGYTALPVWDDLQSDNTTYSGFEIQSQWSRAVAVTANRGTQPSTVRVSYLNGVWQGDDKGNPVSRLPNNVYNAAPANIDQFYWYQPQLAALGTCDRAILDASANYAYGTNFQPGDYLVLIAMHVMTKEQPAWTFQSFWWSDRPNTGQYSLGRPNLPQAKGPWAHYLMASTYGWPEKSGGSTWPVAYNPYIELAADHPIQTNCMNCHHRAAWPNDGTGYLAPNGPGALDVFAPGNSTIFNGLLSVDSLWSISDRVPTSPPSPSPTGVAKRSR